MVETFASRAQWNALSEEDAVRLANKISGLPSADDDDEYSRRFDLLILNLQTAILQNSGRQQNYRLQLVELAKGLEDKAAIPAVAAQMALIMELQHDAWWQDVTLPMLEEVRIHLRDLTRFIDKQAGLVDVFTNFEDELQEASGEYNLVKSDPKLKDYRQSVRRFINEHRDHVTIRRLRNNEPVSPTDVAALEDILFAEDGAIPRQEYEKIYAEKPLGVLVRSVVGLSRKAAQEAFSEFLSAAPMHPDQIAFLHEVVEYLVKNGTIQPKVMFDSPFTLINDQGIAGIFDEDGSKKIIQLVRHINENAGIESHAAL